jgi:ribonuclease BN (tRNA processing enzyme)
MLNGRIKFAGTGNMRSFDLGNSSMLVRMSFGNVLVDCGYANYERMVKSKLIDEVEYLMITHLHGDHAGSIHPLLLYLRFQKNVRCKIIVPDNNFKKYLIDYFSFFLSDYSKYVEFVDLKHAPGVGYFETTGLHSNKIVSYAYTFRIGRRFVYYSGDLGDVTATERFLQWVLNYNPGMQISDFLVLHETSFIERSGHTYYKDLMRLAEKYEVYAYHCDHRRAPKDCSLKFVADADK